MISYKLWQDISVYGLRDTHVLTIDYKVDIKEVNRAIRGEKFHKVFHNQEEHGRFVKYDFTFIPRSRLEKYLEENEDGEKTPS